MNLKHKGTDRAFGAALPVAFIAFLAKHGYEHHDLKFNLWESLVIIAIEFIVAFIVIVVFSFYRTLQGNTTNILKISFILLFSLIVAAFGYSIFKNITLGNPIEEIDMMMVKFDALKAVILATIGRYCVAEDNSDDNNDGKWILDD